MGGRTRALIVDPEPQFRARLRAALSEHVDVVDDVPDAAAGARFLAAESVDLIVISLPGAEFADTARALREGGADAVIVYLNRPADPAAAGVHSRSAAELRNLARIFVGLGSVPRGPAQPPLQAAVPSL